MTSVMTSVMTSRHDGRHDDKPFLMLWFSGFAVNKQFISTANMCLHGFTAVKWGCYGFVVCFGLVGLLWI